MDLHRIRLISSPVIRGRCDPSIPYQTQERTVIDNTKSIVGRIRLPRITSQRGIRAADLRFWWRKQGVFASARAPVSSRLFFSPHVGNENFKCEKVHWAFMRELEWTKMSQENMEFLIVSLFKDNWHFVVSRFNSRGETLGERKGPFWFGQNQSGLSVTTLQKYVKTKKSASRIHVIYFFAALFHTREKSSSRSMGSATSGNR